LCCASSAYSESAIDHVAFFDLFNHGQFKTQLLIALSVLLRGGCRILYK
jgi:hypothetical protein